MNNKKIAAPGEGAAVKTSKDTIARFRQESSAIADYLLVDRIRAVVRRRLGLVETPPVEPRSSVVAGYIARRRAELAGGGR